MSVGQYRVAKASERSDYLQGAANRFERYHDTDQKMWLTLFAWAGMPVVRVEEPEPGPKPIDPGVQALLKEIDAATEGFATPRHERALFILLSRWAAELPYSTGEYGGAQWFIKAFRQTDVTSDGQTDMAIWSLLNGSKIVWGVIEKHFEALIPIPGQGGSTP